MELETTSIYVIFVTNNIVHCNCHGMALIFRTKVVWAILSGKTFLSLNISSNFYIRKKHRFCAFCDLIEVSFGGELRKAFPGISIRRNVSQAKEYTYRIHRTKATKLGSLL